jgi:hypothetical protein
LKRTLAVGYRNHEASQEVLIRKSRESEINSERGASIDIHAGLKSKSNFLGLNRNKRMAGATSVVLNGQSR